LNKGWVKDPPGSALLGLQGNAARFKLGQKAEPRLQNSDISSDPAVQ
jgi:hypothetical protein